MDWHITDVESLAAIDRVISNKRFSPAEYEIVRRVIYRTADFDYYSSLHFSRNALQEGRAALSAHTSIVVDISAIQSEIAPLLYKTFLNPVYCCSNVTIKSRQKQSIYSLGLIALAKSHPEGIYIIGQEQTAFDTLIKLAQQKVIEPSLVIATMPLFGLQKKRNWLMNSTIPHICLNGRKGGVSIALSIIKSLLRLVDCDRGRTEVLSDRSGLIIN